GAAGSKFGSARPIHGQLPPAPRKVHMMVMNLDFTEDEKLALTALLTRTIDEDRCQLSSRLDRLNSAFAKFKPHALRKPSSRRNSLSRRGPFDQGDGEHE